MPVHQPTNAFALANPSRPQQGAVSKSVGYLNRTPILVPRTPLASTDASFRAGHSRNTRWWQDGSSRSRSASA